MNAFNAEAFEAWLRSTGRKWYHMSESKKREAIREFKNLAK